MSKFFVKKILFSMGTYYYKKDTVPITFLNFYRLEFINKDSDGSGRRNLCRRQGAARSQQPLRADSAPLATRIR